MDNIAGTIGMNEAPVNKAPERSREDKTADKIKADYVEQITQNIMGGVMTEVVRALFCSTPEGKDFLKRYIQNIGKETTDGIMAEVDKMYSGLTELQKAKSLPMEKYKDAVVTACAISVETLHTTFELDRKVISIIS
jgi:hypothetical protein